MLEYLIDDLVIWAYRNELLKDYEKRYVYEYAIQVILYNMMLLVVTFLISVGNFRAGVEHVSFRPQTKVVVLYRDRENRSGYLQLHNQCGQRIF